ncbi:hypothetical protein DEA98_13750 [Brucella pseudogrignonensis]|uniref:DUF4376 domain-containing protein n=1 Tax=Brucella pseudogrignonensis TaxID=419475 RepID=A0A7Y3T4P9_9HYPH|nr:hypothetical protein [Brucella pseudogrignonensis]MCM0751955.1 hypothetical protein [Brucella pseudogrignonensis]NNV20641.1 hypothetical protein [Brucella pseudogrignonensis]
MKYFHTNVDGREVWGSAPDLPEDATEMSETEWQTGIDAARQQPAATLEQIKSTLKAGVDAAAEAERLKYITPGNGQAMTYQQKVAEAQAYKAASNPKAADYPILSSEVGITAETLAEVADIVLSAFAQWQQIGAMIESIRLGAKRDIDAAEDEAEARAFVDAVVWPSAQVQS